MISKYMLIIWGSVDSAVPPIMQLLLRMAMLLFQITRAKDSLLSELQPAGFEIGARLIEPFGSREEFVADNLLNDRARTASGKYVITAIDHVYVATLPESFDGISGLQLQQANPGFAARKHENHPDPAGDNFLEFGAEIVRQTEVQAASDVPQCGFRREKRTLHVNFGDAQNIDLTGDHSFPCGQRESPLTVDSGIADDFDQLEALQRFAPLPEIILRVDHENTIDRQAGDGCSQRVIGAGTKAGQRDITNAIAAAKELDRSADVVYGFLRKDIILGAARTGSAVALPPQVHAQYHIAVLRPAPRHRHVQPACANMIIGAGIEENDRAP